MSSQRGNVPHRHRGSSLSLVIACVVGIALGSGPWLHGFRAADGVSNGSSAPQTAAAMPHSSWGLYLPVALLGDFVAGPRPIDPRTPTPTEPTAEPTPTPTELPPTADVVFQIATYGGLSMDVMLSYMPSMTPWFTLYADGSYIRFHQHREEPYALERFSGRLDETALQAFQRTLTDDIGVFELPGRPEPMICVTDHPYDRVFLDIGGRQHSMVVYGLSVYADGGYRCPETPDDGLVALAEFVAWLREPLADTEQPYEIERGTLVAVEEDPWPTTLPVWPISRTRLADLPATSPRALLMQGDEAREVADAVADAAEYGMNVTYFREGEAFWLVGFRVEFDGWGAYGPSFFPRRATAIGRTAHRGNRPVGTELGPAASNGYARAGAHAR